MTVIDTLNDAAAIGFDLDLAAKHADIAAGSGTARAKREGRNQRRTASG